jgi:hypothetical protein
LRLVSHPYAVADPDRKLSGGNQMSGGTFGLNLIFFEIYFFKYE